MSFIECKAATACLVGHCEEAQRNGVRTRKHSDKVRCRSTGRAGMKAYRDMEGLFWQ